MTLLALDDVSGSEKLKLVRELGTIRKNLPDVAGVNKLTLVKRVREIRQLLSIAIKPVTSLTIDPTNPAESIKKLTDYLRNGISAVPESLRGAEADTLTKIIKMLSRGSDEKAYQEANSDWMDAYADLRIPAGGAAEMAAFEHYKSAGNVFDVDADRIKSIEDEIKELSYKPPQDTPEILAEQKAAQEEYEKLRLALTDLLAVNEANGYDKEAIEKASNMFEVAALKKQEVWEKLITLDRQKHELRKNQVKELKESLEPIGKKIIETILGTSKVTMEEAESWANSQVIGKSAIARLKKAKYPEAEVRRDMAEFYRISGGKLRLIKIESERSGRAHAKGIGHFEDASINPGNGFNKTVLWHEMAHHLEADSAAKSAANGYLLKRRQGDKVYSLKSLTGNRAYGSNEGAYKDDFIDPYVGKVYRDQTTEVWAMGIQYLANPYDAAMLAFKDPEMAALMAGYLQADLTPAMKLFQSLQDQAKDIVQGRRDTEQSEYEKALEKLSEGVEIVGDNWFNDLDVVDRENLLGKLGGLNDPKAKYIGSWGGYRVFAGKFKNPLSKRIANGFGVAFTNQSGSFVYPGDPSRRNIPTSIAVHGDMLNLKAFLRMASMSKDNILGVFYHRATRKDRVIEMAKELQGEQS
ncbi:hypothetical protein [Nitrosomonas sp.]|uniref:hypothetical protein n=1 Tax=Nitrosomonas sp. TaxID=42353 RepID=UPI0025D72362|nr:hypothetical protein [Nitrosomonas sp.]